MDRTIKHWDIMSGKLINSLQSSDVSSVAMSPCGTYEVVGYQDSSCVIKDIKTSD